MIQVIDPDTVIADLKKSEKVVKIKLAKANLGGANITWIQPLGEGSVFSEFNKSYGDGAMSLVYRLGNEDVLRKELNRLAAVGVEVKEEISIDTEKGELNYVLMDTRDEGKFYLGYTCRKDDTKMMQELASENLHDMQLNQYAFAIRNGTMKNLLQLSGKRSDSLSLRSIILNWGINIIMVVLWIMTLSRAGKGRAI